MLAAVIGSAVTTVDTTLGPRYAAGTTMIDPATGNVFVYCVGVGSVAQYDWVTFNSATFALTRAAHAGVGPVGVAQGAINSATSYGWVQQAGQTTANAVSGTTANKPLYISATTSQVQTTGIAGDWIQGAWGITASSGGTLTAALYYPGLYASAYLT